MEDSSQGSRRTRLSTRPESSSSNNTRMTSNSSNNSAANPPSLRSSTTSTNGGSSLLQERLRERKVESLRQSQRVSTDMTSTGINREVQSSPVRGTHERDERRPSSSGKGASSTSKMGLGMGVKQMEDVSFFLQGIAMTRTHSI